MRGTSEVSRDAVLAQFGATASAAGADATRLAEELFSVVDALDSSGSLRRALTDPARSGTDKGTLVASLFGAFDPRVRDLVSAFADRRWILASDLGDAIEDAAVEAHLASAQSEGRLDALEEELFSVERFLATERDVLSALGDRAASPDARARLARELFGASVGPTTLALVERAARQPRKRRLTNALAYYIAVAAARSGKAVVQVTAAVDLGAAHRERLASILRASLGREVRLNVSVDPSVIGGMRIQVGERVVDGTILSKLDEVQRQLVG
jgi:F-type H+-transporting ATPase subunit delta